MRKSAGRSIWALALATALSGSGCALLSGYDFDGYRIGAEEKDAATDVADASDGFADAARDTRQADAATDRRERAPD